MVVAAKDNIFPLRGVTMAANLVEFGLQSGDSVKEVVALPGVVGEVRRESFGKSACFAFEL